MYSADPRADHDRHRRLLVEDDRIRRFYVEGLWAIGGAIDEEFSRDQGADRGSHIFVTGRAPGAQGLLPPPEPRCPTCRAVALRAERFTCTCESCGREYQSRFGIPYLLIDDSATYSPKSDAGRRDERPLDRRIDSAIDAMAAWFQAHRSVTFFGVDPSSAFVIRRLCADGVRVAGVVSTDPSLEGFEIEGVPIHGLRAVSELALPVIVSAYPSSARTAEAALTPFTETEIVYLEPPVPSSSRSATEAPQAASDRRNRLRFRLPR